MEQLTNAVALLPVLLLQEDTEAFGSKVRGAFRGFGGVDLWVSEVG